MQTISVPLRKETGIPGLDDVEKVLALLVAWVEMDVGIRREKACIGLPPGACHKALIETEKALQMFEPDAGHGASISGPEQLDLMALQNRDQKAEAAAKDGMVELSRLETLSDVHAPKPVMDKESERLHL